MIWEDRIRTSIAPIIKLNLSFLLKTMELKQATTILRIFDETKAKDFYIDYLGFVIDWEHRFKNGMPLYLQISRSSCSLHLSEHHGDGTPGTKVRIECDNVKAYHKELKA